MPKNNFVFLTILMILSISLMSFMEFRALAQANNPVSSETVPDTSSETDTDEEEDGFDAEFEDEFGDAEKEVFDPLSGYNSVMTEFNDGFYIFVLDPVARGYRWVLPEVARRGVKNFSHLYVLYLEVPSDIHEQPDLKQKYKNRR